MNAPRAQQEKTCPAEGSQGLEGLGMVDCSWKRQVWDFARQRQAGGPSPMAASGQMKGVASPMGARKGNEEGQKVAWGHVLEGLELQGKGTGVSLGALAGRGVS